MIFNGLSWILITEKFDEINWPWEMKENRHGLWWSPCWKIAVDYDKTLSINAISRSQSALMGDKTFTLKAKRKRVGAAECYSDLRDLAWQITVASLQNAESVLRNNYSVDSNYTFLWGNQHSFIVMGEEWYFKISLRKSFVIKLGRNVEIRSPSFFLSMYSAH